MIDTNAAPLELRTNQAVAPAAPFGPPRLVATRSDSVVPGGSAVARTATTQTEAGERPNLLARMARAARLAVDEVRHSGDVPLPHLYRGRDFRQRRDAA